MNWEIDPSDSIEERIACDSYDALTDAERTYHALWWLFFVAYGPGLLVYFDETERSQIETAMTGLATIESLPMLAIFRDAMDHLPGDYFHHPVASRNGDLDDHVADAIDALNSRFTDIPYPEDALTSFVESNDAAFAGPRTKLGLWESKHRRGASTSPKFTVKSFDREREAEKDRAYSTRSCPHCDYPSPDYRPTCKACGFPHGKGEPSRAPEPGLRGFTNGQSTFPAR